MLLFGTVEELVARSAVAASKILTLQAVGS